MATSRRCALDFDPLGGVGSRKHPAPLDPSAGVQRGKQLVSLFTNVAKSLLGGSFSGLSDARGNPAAGVDAAGLASGEVAEWLSGLPIGQGAELQVAWVADRLGARMSLERFAANIGDLWFSGMDDIVCVLPGDRSLMVLVLDHEELITLSSVNPDEYAG
jgi:hypothetical protein